jgi:hypothetical protein
MGVDAGRTEERAAVRRRAAPPWSDATTPVGELELEWRPLGALEPDREAWRRFPSAPPCPTCSTIRPLAAAPALGARVQAALVWSRTHPRRLLGFFLIRRERRYGPLGPVAVGWTHVLRRLGRRSSIVTAPIR